MSVPAFVIQNSLRRKQYASTFRRLFGCSLSSFWSNVTGLDLVAFDDQVIQSGHGCMEDVVRARYGEDAVQCIRSLLGTE